LTHQRQLQFLFKVQSQLKLSQPQSLLQTKTQLKFQISLTMFQIIPSTVNLKRFKEMTKIKLMHDIETNPGPTNNIKNKEIKIVTLNCRGLGNIDKFRLLLNRVYDIMKTGQIIVLLQGTMILDPSYLNFAWRGNYVFTPGTGNSQGCITLTNTELCIEHIQHFGNRGHYFTLNIPNEDPILVINLYAPTGYDNRKSDFFSDLFDTASNYDCDLIIGGDFNVTLSDQERHCRGVTQNETAIATLVNDYIDYLSLSDIWTGRQGHTWRRGKMLSRLDRILTRLTTMSV
jgi:hypothetical protein